MPGAYDEDLFEETKMTFGEHLEELRHALLRSVIALFLGFLVGLLTGNWVVQRIQDPLKIALGDYYEEKDIARFHEQLQSRLDSGEVLPDELERIAKMPIKDSGTKEAFRAMLGEERMIPKEVYLHIGQIVKELKRHDPASFGHLADPTNTDSLKREAMIRIFLWHTLKEDDRVRVTALSAQEAFLVYIKASLVSGAVFASPFIFYFVWSFIASGLYPHEKSYVYVFGPISLGLFIAGALLAFFVVFRYVLNFLLGINAWVMIDPDPRISEWIGFALMLPIGFGVSFQLPLLMLFLERIGVFTVTVYWEKWRIAVLAISILSMLLTPADPMSMILMAAPLTLLYFGGIAFCRFMPKRKGPFRETID